METIVVRDKEHLKSIIKNSPDDADLNHLDVSNIKDMNRLFRDTTFNGNINHWDVSNVTNMSFMFQNSEFDGDISQWDVSSVTDMSYMFRSKFNQWIGQWDVSNVTNMCAMFAFGKFDGDLSQWKISEHTNTFEMFKENDAYHKKHMVSLYTEDKVLEILKNIVSEISGDKSNNAKITELFRPYTYRSYLKISKEILESDMFEYLEDAIELKVN